MAHIDTFKGWAESIRQDIDAYKALLESTKADDNSKKLAGGALSYLVSKMDLIPDWNEGIGVIDDVMVLRVCAQLTQGHERGTLPTAAEVSLDRMANEADHIAKFLGGPIYDKLKSYCAKLGDAAVRGRTPIQLARRCRRSARRSTSSSRTRSRRRCRSSSTIPPTPSCASRRISPTSSNEARALVLVISRSSSRSARIAHADDTFEAKAANAQRIRHLENVVWALTAPCDAGDDTQQRQCRTRATRAQAELIGTTLLVDADIDAFDVGAWSAQKKSVPVTLSSCIRCGGVDLDGKTWFIVGAL